MKDAGRRSSVSEMVRWLCCSDPSRATRRMKSKSDLNAYIEDIGAYQWRVVIAAFILIMYTADSIYIIFIAGDMPHWCRVPELEDLPYDVQKNVAIPAQSMDRDGSVEYSSCEMFSLNYSVYNRSQFFSWNRSLMVTNQTSLVQCSEWTFDRSQFISTIVSKVRHAGIKIAVHRVKVYLWSSCRTASTDCCLDRSCVKIIIIVWKIFNDVYCCLSGTSFSIFFSFFLFIHSFWWILYSNLPMFHLDVKCITSCIICNQ